MGQICLLETSECLGWCLVLMDGWKRMSVVSNSDGFVVEGEFLVELNLDSPN